MARNKATNVQDDQTDAVGEVEVIEDFESEEFEGFEIDDADSDADADTLDADSEVPVEEKWTAPDEVAAMMFGKFNGLVATHNAGHRRIAANSGDLKPLLDDAFASSEDPQIVEMRARIEEMDEERERLNVAAREILKADIEAARMTPDEIAALETSLKAIKKDLSDGLPVFERMYKGITAALDPLAGSSRRGKSGGKGATGGRKPRVGTIYVDGVPMQETKLNKEGQEIVVSTFTLAATAMKAKVVDLHAAYFDAAKTQEIDKVPDSVEFVISVGDTNYTVRVDK